MTGGEGGTTEPAAGTTRAAEGSAEVVTEDGEVCTISCPRLMAAEADNVDGGRWVMRKREAPEASGATEMVSDASQTIQSRMARPMVRRGVAAIRGESGRRQMVPSDAGAIGSTARPSFAIVSKNRVLIA